MNGCGDELRLAQSQSGLAPPLGFTILSLDAPALTLPL
jgi:hypothetical protein